ncbi:MAG TPA: glutathione S-transferase family protein [Azospirillaceae bacterium]|nr:glutathione S-transferase family protein [Azospirillaceae bacterium]
MPTLYDNLSSGNAYKVRLVLHRLDIPHHRIDLDIDRGETRTPEFLAKNPNGRVPALELEDGTVLAESNAIIHYLAEGTPLIPQGRLERARMLQWMFFEQYSHEPHVAVARFILHHLPADHPRRAELPMRHERGHQALAVMETHLRDRAFFAAGRFTLADVALYAYTHVADEGGFDLAPYPRIRAWLTRVAAEPRHIPITRTTGS